MTKVVPLLVSQLSLNPSTHGGLLTFHAWRFPQPEAKNHRMYSAKKEIERRRDSWWCPSGTGERGRGSILQCFPDF